MTRGFIIAAAMLLATVSATAQTGTEVSYADDFQSYATPGDPPGWIDNPIGVPRREADGLFKVWPDPLATSNNVYGTKQASGQPDGNTPRIGTFSTLTTRNFSGTGRFEYRGRLLRTNSDSRIGLTFFSAYTDVDQYYLVGLWSLPGGGLSMQLHSFGAGAPAGTVDSGFVPDPNVWYRFLIQADDTAGETRIRVRFWPDGTQEPSTFSIDAVDAAPTRLTSGRIGMWAAVKGDAYIDDVTAKSPVDHTPPVITILESGNPLADGSKFNRDAIPDIRVSDDLSTFTSTATLDGAPYTSLTPVTAEGWHTLVVRATDGPGNSSEVSVRFLVDKTPPLVVILENGNPFPNGFFFNRDVIPTASVTDTTNAPATATLNGQPYNLDSPITTEGEYTLSVTAVDEVGWTTTAGPVTFVIDKTAPALTFTSHRDGDVLTVARAAIAGTSDDAISITVAGTTATIDPAARTFATAEVPLLEGENLLTATGQDRAGNIGTATLRVLVDTRAPAIAISTPAADACVDATTVQVSGTASDARLETVKVTIGQTSVPATITGDSWTAMVPVADEGNAIITVEATDSVGHTISSSRTITIDRTPPVLDIRENGSPFTAAFINRTVSFFIRADDRDPSVAVVATLDGQPYATGTAVSAEGAHRLVVKATDCAGHAAEKTIDFTIDLTPPAIRNLEPANGSSIGTMPDSIRGETDDDAVRVELAVPALGAQPAADGAFVIAAVPFEEGTNRFAITARDEAGNTSTVDYSVRVKTTGPILEIRESGSPMISGTLFNRAVTPVIRSNEIDATIAATLNGAVFTSGNAIENDGAYTLRATATGTLGHVTTEEVTFTIDRTPPVVKINSPQSGPAQSDRVDVQGTVGDAVTVALNGQPVTIAADRTFVVTGVVLDIGPNPLVLTGRDEAGNIGRDEILLTRDALGSGIIITYPPDRSRTNRATTDVAGRVLSPGRVQSVTIGTTAVPVDATGGFRLSGYELVEGENTIRATAAASDGTAHFAETRVTADFTPPSLTILESGQPLSDGARFATQAVITLDAADTGGGAVTTTLTIDGSAVAAPSTVTREGGHAAIATATDLAGNQTRSERTFFIGESTGAAGCALDAFDPAGGSVILDNQTLLVGRTGGAAGVKVNGVAATVADGAFFATVELPVEGANAITIACTDVGGVPIGTPVVITLQRVTGEPSISIATPDENFVSAEETIAVSGTVGPGVVSADVNGVPATISGTDATVARPFTVSAVRLSAGLNLLVARGRNGGGRTASASRRGLYIKDAPAVQISSPSANTITGSPSISVSGTYSGLDPASLVVENLGNGAQESPSTVRTSDTAGRWTAAAVGLNPGDQTLRVTGRDRLNRPATATVVVRLVAGSPSIAITAPADQSWFGGGSDSVTVSGTFQAAPGAAVDVNGVVATIEGSSYSAPVTFSTLAGGVTPIVARVTEPGGASASAMITVRQLADAPSVIESFPAPEAVEVDPGALLLVLFSQPMDVATVSSSFRLESSSGAPVSGSLFLDRDVLTFAPATLLTPGARYTLRVSSAATNLAGTPLTAAYSSSFTIASTAPGAPPVLAPLAASVCGDAITIDGTAAAGARVRLESGALTLNTTADAAGAFSFSVPISGQSGYALIRVRVVGSDGSLSPAAERQIRIDCSGPQVLNAAYDRIVNKLTISFSEPVDSATVSAGTSVSLTLEDGQPVGGTIAVTGNSAVLTPSEDLTAKTFTLTVTTAVHDTLGNALIAPFTQRFAIGGTQPAAGDGSGFISGEVYDATTGRPLAGATISIDVASPSPVTTVSDARGRYVAKLPEGAHTIEAAMNGYTTVWRGIIVPAGAGVIPIDIRLTRRGEAQTAAGSALTVSHGGDTAVTRNAELRVPGGVLPAGATIALTSIGGQALTGLLPLGWSPLAAAEIFVGGTAALPGATLDFAVPAPDIAAASQNLTAVHYDAARDEWRVVVSVVNISGDRASIPISSAGTFALVYPDRAPGLTPPPLAAAGDVLRGVPAAAPDAPAMVRRDFTLDPPIVLPDGRAVATLRIEGSGATYPSGTAVQAYIDEELRLADGSRLLDPPFAADLLLYRTLSGDLGVAAFHLAPTPRAAQVVLETGVDRIRVFPYPGRLDRGTLVGSEGGPVPADGKVAIEIPSGAVPEPLRATAMSLSESEIQGLGPVAGFRVVGGFQLTLQRVTEPAPIDLDGDGVPEPADAPELFMPARATYSVDSSLLPSPDAQVVLAEVLDETPFGRMVRLAVPMSRVGTGETTPVTRFTTDVIDRSLLPVDGVAREGRYIVLAAEAPVAFATGTIRSGSALGKLLVDARITAPPLGIADLSRSTGIYSIVVPSAPAAPFTLVPRHTTTGEGAPYVHATAPAAAAVVRVDLALSPQPPVLGQVVVLRGNPPSQAALSTGAVTRDVALTTNVRASFTPAIDPASVTADSITVSDATTGATVSGAASADGTVGVVWTLTAGETLKPNARYIVVVSPSIRGSNGAALGQGSSFSFETVTQVLNSEINRDRIRITIPDDEGMSRISGDPGALPAGWQAVAVRRGRDFNVRYQATAAGDGSFAFFIGNGGDPNDRVTIGDLIDLRVVNNNGALAAIFALTPFASEDGKSFVVPTGMAVRYTTPEGLTLDVPEGAFDEPTVITVNAATKEEFLDIEAFEAENEFLGSVDIQFDGTAKKPLRFEAPVPAGFNPEGKTLVLAQKMMSPRGPRLALIDLMAVEGDMLVTDHGESTNASAIVVGSGLRQEANQTLTGSKFTRYLRMIINSGIYSYHDIRQPVGGAVGWAAMEGLQAGYDLMWDIFASYFIPHIHVFERGGALLPIVTGKRFTVVGVDAGTGLQGFSRTYDPIPFGPPGTVTPIEPAQQNDGGPYPVFGSPFRVEMLDLEVEEVDLRSIRNFNVRLENSTVTVTPGSPALPSETKVTLLNVSKGTSQTATAGASMQLAADPGNRIVLLIEERQVDPTTPISIVFNEPIFVVDPNDPETVNVALQSLMQVDYAPKPVSGAPNYTDITKQVRFTTDSGQRRVNLQLPSALQSDAVYRLTLKENIADLFNGNPGLTLGMGTVEANGVLTPVGGGTPLELHFSVRTPAGQLGSFTATPNGMIRGMELSGNLLFVAAWDGGLRAYDVSNPAALSGSPSSVGEIPGPPFIALSHLAVTIDRHDRIYTTAHLPIAGLFRSYRVEEFKGGYQDIPVRGSKIINWVLGYSSMIGLPSNTVLSDVPESIPFRIKVVLQDDETNFVDRKSFVAGTGASESGDFPLHDLKSYSVSIARSGTPYKTQRITIENPSLDMKWSADATESGPATFTNVVARSTDRLRLIRNQKTFAVVAHLGYGIGVYDANAIESNRAAMLGGSSDKLREQLVLTAGLIARDCPNETPAYGIVENYITTDAELRGDVDGTLYSYSTDPHRGILDLHLNIPSDTTPGTRDDDCDQRHLQDNTGGLLFRSTPEGNETDRMKELKSAFSAAAGRAPYGHVSQMARFFWSIPADQNARGLRGTTPEQPAEREYLLVASHEWGLVVVDIDSNPLVVPLFPLWNDNIADIIWIPGGAVSVRVYQSANVAVVGDRYGRAYVVDLSRIDERYDANRQWVPGLFPTVKNALASPANDPYGVGADDPRILWKSEPGAVGGSVAPVFDPYTGMLFSGNLQQVKVHSAIDPRVTMKVNLGDNAGLSEVGGVVPLGVPLPLEIEQRVAGLPACDGTTLACKENASLAAFRLELSLPGDMNESLMQSSNELWMAVESERVAGATTEQTPDGFPRSHLRRRRPDGSSELASRAASSFRFQRVVPDSLSNALRRQRGYNKFISPWIVAIADPRASELYQWQNASTKQEKKEAGCDECERPQHLQQKDENDDVYELLTNGRFITVRPELSNGSQTIFANTQYSYLGGEERLMGRFSTVMADTVRPTDILVAGQNPPVAMGMLQETTYLHSGELQSGAIDLDAGGRSGYNVLVDRKYRSRTLGGTVFGLGWDSSLLRRLRALPNGNVEYRDGGEVWMFRPDPASGGYESPKGLFLKLTRTGNGWQLIDQGWRIMRFDDLGRILSESDEFYDPQKPDSGNIIRYVYDESGRLAEVVDPVKRHSRISYWPDDASGTGAYPGLIRQIVDWRGRVIDFVYDASAGTLVKVQLADVQNATGGRPAFEYGYVSSTGSGYSDRLELRSNLESIKDPKEVVGGGAARVQFTYGLGGGLTRDRILTQKWGTGESVSFDWQSETSGSTTDALGQQRKHTLTEAPKNAFDDRPHVVTLVETSVPVSSTPFGTLPQSISAGVPPTSSADRTMTFDYDDQGQLETETLSGVRSISRQYIDVRPIAPGFVPGGMTTNPLGGPTAAVTIGMSYQSGPNASTYISSVSANGLAIEGPAPSRTNQSPDSSNDQIDTTGQFDDNGLPTASASSGGTDAASGGAAVGVEWADASAPEHERALVKSIDVGGLKTTIQYPSAQQSITTSPRGVVTTRMFDTWDRPVSISVTGPGLSLNEQFQYDASGRLVKRTRLQGSKTVTESWTYDVMGRETAHSIDEVAGVGSATTTTVHNLSNRTVTRTLPSGAVQTMQLDSLGRVSKQVTTTGSGTLEDHFAYDLLDNVVQSSDLFGATASAYDAYGQLVGRMGLDGIKVRATVDAWGRAIGFIKEDAAGQQIAESTFEYTPAGRLKSVSRKLDSGSRDTSFAWDGGGRFTGMSVAGRTHHATYDAAGRLLSKEEGAGSATGVSSAFRSAQITSHSGMLPQMATTSEKGSGGYGVALQYNTLGRSVGQTLGGLAWERSVDQAGNVISRTVPGRSPRLFEYDSRNALQFEVLPDGAVNTYGYHPSGALASFTDPSSEVTGTTNDLVGRPVARSFKDGTEERIEWEGRRVRSITDRQGRVQTFTYNARGQIAEVRSGAGDLLESIQYDEAGRVTRWANNDAVLEFSDFDAEGHPRKTAQTRLAGGSLIDRYEQEHAWNVHGERSSWTMPTYSGFLSLRPWSNRIVKHYDEMGNVIQLDRSIGAGGASMFLQADYRDAGRPNYRKVTPEGSSTILTREYGYDGGNGLLNRMAVVVNGKTIAGSEVEYEGLMRVRARLLGLSNGFRSDEWIYDARGRLAGSSLGLQSDAAPQTEQVTAADFRAALDRPSFGTPADPLTITYTEDSSGGHKIKVMQRGSTIEEFLFNGGERIEDGRFRYEYDGKGRLAVATENSTAAVRRRARFFYDPRGRLVGRRLEYAVPLPGLEPQPSDWRLEDRPEVLDADGLPADATLVWDPVSDHLVAIFKAGSSEEAIPDDNGGLVRQIIHGGFGYDDPIEITAADPTASEGLTRLYPIYDEAGGHSLQVVLNDLGQIVARSIAAGPYGEDQAVLAGPAVDQVNVTARKNEDGDLLGVDITIRSTEQVAAQSVAAGFRLTAVNSAGAVVRATSSEPELTGESAVTWTLTPQEWEALQSGGAALSIATTDEARGATWGEAVPFLRAPAWATSTKPVYSSPELPLEVRESLATLSQWLASIPAGAEQTIALYEVPNLYALAAPRIGASAAFGGEDPLKYIVASPFHAHPFQDPFTGQNYVRARWFDLQSGAWLTPDPAGYEDSSNLYVYAGGDPVNFVDSTGRNASGGDDEEPSRAVRFAKWLIKEAAATALEELTPVGVVNGLCGAIVGYDFVRNEPVEGFAARALALASALPLVPSAVRKLDDVADAAGDASRAGRNAPTSAIDDAARGVPDRPRAGAAGGAPLPGGAARVDAPRAPDAGSTGGRRVASADDDVVTVYHAQEKYIQDVLDGIDPNKLSPNARFGKAFYTAEQGRTAIREVMANGGNPSMVIRYNLDLGKAKVLDLTDAKVASEWGYLHDVADRANPQLIAARAKELGYDVIKVLSHRGEGANYNVLNRFNELLTPQNLSPARW